MGVETGAEVVEKLNVEVGVVDGVVEKLKEEGAGVVVDGVEKVVVAGVEVVGVGTLKVVAAGVGVWALKIFTGAGDVNTFRRADDVAAICAGSGVDADVDIGEDVGASVMGVGFLKRRILKESYATTSSITMNASIWSRIGIVQPGTANVIVLSAAMITLTPGVSAYNMFAFKVKVMSVWSR